MGHRGISLRQGKKKEITGVITPRKEMIYVRLVALPNTSPSSSPSPGIQSSSELVEMPSHWKNSIGLARSPSRLAPYRQKQMSTPWVRPVQAYRDSLTY